MLLEKLPVELVQHIIGLVVQDGEHNDRPKNLTAMLGVNKALENEATHLHLRSLRNIKQDYDWWRRMPFPIRRCMAHDTIISEPLGAKRTIATYMHAVAYYLQQYAEVHDPDVSGRLSYTQWLHEVSSVLAPSEADCECGKPASMHSICYGLASVPDTAFHVVLLKQHTKLEAMMILEEGKSVDSVCPYLKVSKKDLIFTRRNALEWACAYGLEASVVRLVGAAEEEGRKVEDYIPTAAAVCAMHSKAHKGALLEFLLNHLDKAMCNAHYWIETVQYQNRTVEYRLWNQKVLTSLAKHRKLDAISMMRRHYPYLDHSWGTFRLFPKDFCQWQSMRKFMKTERPHCNFGARGKEGGDRKHWISCSKTWCCNLHSKANPWCGECMHHHHPELRRCERCERHHVRDGTLFDLK